MSQRGMTIYMEIPQPDGLRLKNRVGIGRRSQWFEAEQVRLNRVIALKCLRPFLAVSEEFRQSFFEAGRQAAAIVHPSALPIFNVFVRQNCIAMQWCGERPIREREGALDPVQTLALGEAVMDCLSSLHATGRCHGNLSPGNVFLGEKGEVWVNDFFHPPVMVAGDRMFMGDQRYIPPEVLTGGAPDWLGDVFSLGRLLQHAANPECRSGEMSELIEYMQSADPAERGDSPIEVMEEMRRIRLMEESRRGLDNTTAQRAKRMYRRVPAEFDVSLRRRSATPVETQTILMKTRDIGESGVFVETDDELIGIGSIVELDFALKGVEGNVHAFGIVRWRSAPPMPPGVGVQFVEVDQAGLARLRQFLVAK